MLEMTPSEYVDFLHLHGKLYMIGWLLLPLPLIVSARYFNIFCRGWIIVHTILGLIMSLPSVILGLYSVLSCPWQHWASGIPHTMLSVVFMLLCMFLLVGGLLLRYYQKKGYANERVLQCLKMTHKLGGYAVIILGFACCHTGEIMMSPFNIKKSDRNSAYGFFYLGFGLVLAALEVLYRLVLAFVKRFEPKAQLVNYDFVENEIAQGRQIMIYEDSVIDIQPYMHLHPGADGLLKQFIGQEVGRFIYGGFPCGTLAGHNHSYESIQLIESLRIATLDNPSHDKLFIPLDVEAGDSKKAIFTLIGKKYINDAHTIFRFRSMHFRTSLILPSVTHCGMYFTLASKQIGVKRDYCCCLTLSPDSFEQHTLLLRHSMALEAFETKYPDINNCYKGEIDIFIRDQHLLSTYVHNLEVPPIGASEEQYQALLPDPRFQFHIGGPFGPGVRFKGDEDGTVVALTTGIASILFVDLAAYLFRMNAYNIGKKNGQKYKIFENEVFDMLCHPNFKLILFATHPSRETSIGLEIFEGLVGFNKHYGLNNFEYHLRSKDQMKEHWTPEFVSDRIGDKSKIIKTFVATGAAHEEPLIRLLTENGIERSGITIL